MVVKYTSKRPDEALDALQDFEEHFTKDAPEDLIIVGVVSRHGISKIDPSNEWQATVRLKQVEVLAGEDLGAGKDLISSAYKHRTGNEPLPLEELGGLDD